MKSAIACAEARLQVPGAALFLQSARDLRAAVAPANAQYQYTLQSG